MPYSKLPIQRASNTWLTKAMTALTTRIENAIKDMRVATPRSSAAKSRESTRASAGRARDAQRSGNSRSAVMAAEKRKLPSPLGLLVFDRLQETL